jgi:hypothetical protein
MPSGHDHYQISRSHKAARKTKEERHNDEESTIGGNVSRDRIGGRLLWFRRMFEGEEELLRYVCQGSAGMHDVSGRRLPVQVARH